MLQAVRARQSWKNDQRLTCRLEGICAYVSFDLYAETDEQSALSLSHVYCWTQRRAHKSHPVGPTGLIKDSQFWQCYRFMNE